MKEDEGIRDPLTKKQRKMVGEPPTKKSKGTQQGEKAIEPNKKLKKNIAGGKAEADDEETRREGGEGGNGQENAEKGGSNAQ